MKNVKKAAGKGITEEEIKELSSEEQLKYEIAKELGLYEKVVADGWKSLSARETGKIGGIISRKKRKRT